MGGAVGKSMSATHMGITSSRPKMDLTAHHLAQPDWLRSHNVSKSYFMQAPPYLHHFTHEEACNTKKKVFGLSFHCEGAPVEPAATVAISITGIEIAAPPDCGRDGSQ